MACCGTRAPQHFNTSTHFFVSCTMAPPKLDPKIFWDTGMEQLDWEKNANAIIIRVLESGSLNDWNEIKRYYGHDRINEAALKARYLSKVTLAFVSSLYEIPITEFRCYTWKQSNPVLWDF